jgi:DNA primase catalytic core
MSHLPAADLTQLKRAVDLVALAQARGVALTKRGADYVGRCPFHEDRRPSLHISPTKNLFHCFGCGAAGSVIDFVMKRDGLTQPEAIDWLVRQTHGQVGRGAAGLRSAAAPANGPAEPPAQAAAPPERLTPARAKLLARVVEFYQGTLTRDPRGVEYLARRGIRDPQSLTDFGVGFANGSLLEALPPEGGVLDDLKAVGLVSARGQEFFADCVVVPLRDGSGAIIGLYGRRITEQEPQHLYLPGPRRGLVNWPAAKRSPTILLTEAILDALTLYAQGFKHVMPCYGVQGFSHEHLTCFQQGGVREVLLCFDADEAGRTGAAHVANRLLACGITCSVLTLPDKDINDYFLRHTPEEFEALVRQAHPLTPVRSEAVAARVETSFEATEAGFRVAYGPRRYEVKGVHRQGGQLRVTLLATRAGVSATPAPIYLDALDLYTARARERFARGAAGVLQEREALLRDDLLRLLERLERWSVAAARSEATPADSTPEAEAAATKFLSNPDLFSELLTDLDTLGLVGEETLKLIGYLTCTSRKLDTPLSLLIQSRSAAGKSACAEALVALMPPEEVRRWTRLTDQALFYQPETALVHKVVVLEELAGASGAAYSIRAMQSARALTLATVAKDPLSGQLRVREHRVQGPVAFLLTTTRPQLDEEMATRFCTLSLDESPALTERILARQRAALTPEGYLQARRREALLAKHQAAQRRLQSLLVLDPQASAQPFGAQALWARREQPKGLVLLRAVTLLHQQQREVKRLTTPEGEVLEYLEVTDADRARAAPLRAHLLQAARTELPAPSRALLAQIEQLARAQAQGLTAPSSEVSVTRRQLQEATGWSLWQLKTYLPPLVEQEYLWVRQGRKGQEYRYELPAAE